MLDRFFCFFFFSHLRCFKSFPPAVLRHRPSTMLHHPMNLFLIPTHCNFSCLPSQETVWQTFGSRAATFPRKKLPWLYERINPDTLANPEGPPQSEKSLPCVNINQLLVSQVTVSEFNYSALCQHHSAQRLYTSIYMNRGGLCVCILTVAQLLYCEYQTRQSGLKRETLGC